MKNNPLVSIVMPAYNAESFINKAIDSILNQSYTHFELIISDDGSTDQTKILIDQYEDYRIKRFHNSHNIGNILTSNTLFKEVKGDLITIQDADDWSDEDRILLQVQAFQLDNELKMCGTQSFKLLDEHSIISKSEFPLTYIELLNKLPNEFCFTSASIMIKRELYDKYKGYNEYFDRKGGVDWYRYGTMILNEKMINLPNHLYYYRHNPGSITNKVPKNIENYIIGKLVVFLLNQYKDFNDDGLGKKPLLSNSFIQYEDELRNNYLKDVNLLQREYAIRLYQHNYKSKSLLLLALNFFKNPVKFIKFVIDKIVS